MSIRATGKSLVFVCLCCAEVEFMCTLLTRNTLYISLGVSQYQNMTDWISIVSDSD